MPIYLDKKTKRLFIEFQYRGERVKERLPKGTKKSAAEAIEIKLKNEILERKHGIGPTAEMTFERFLKEYFGPHIEHHYSPDSFDKAVVVCKAAMPFFKGKPLRAIKHFDIEKFVQARTNLLTMHGTKRKPATIARELSIISKIFSLAVKNDLCDYNPCARVEKPVFDNVMDRVLEWEDEEKFFANMHSEWARDICKLVLNTGLRRNDVMNLTRFKVDRPARLIRLIQGKTKRRVLIPLNDEAMEIIDRRWTGKSELLFPSPVTGKETGSVTHAMLRACKRAGIAPLTIRDLRRTYGTRADTDSVTLARLLGHGDLRSVHRYNRNLEKMRETVNNLKNPNTIPADEGNVTRLKRKG